MKTTTGIVQAPLAALALACFGSSPMAQAVVPPPDGGYAGGNTAAGQNALFSLTTGGFNTALGFYCLRSDTTASFNTAIGAGALFANTGEENTATGVGALFSNTGDNNTATGAFALFSNTGQENTATGVEALLSNTTGSENTAIDYDALYSNTTGGGNTATGWLALENNTDGYDNSAFGADALAQNTNGIGNTASGVDALFSNTIGAFNTGEGYLALVNNTGSNNIALGAGAGGNLTTEDYNIDIGNAGVGGESGTIRIGDSNYQGATYIAGIYGVSVSGLTVVMDSSNRLGTVASSRRFKEEIRPMDKASEAILALKPVAFRYKKEIDPDGTSQFGLVAEEVEKVDPDLVVRDKEGKPYTVRYDQVNTMLLNEFLKEHRRVEALEATIAKQQKDFQATAAHQQRQIESLTANLQRVIAQAEMSRRVPQVVVNDQ